MEQQTKKKRKGWKIALLVVLCLVLLVGIGLFSVAKSYLSRMERIDPESVEIVAPEDEFFDVDEPAQAEADSETSAGTPSGEEEAASGGTSSGNGGTAVMDPSEVKLEPVQTIEDDHLINVLLLGEDRYPGQKGPQQRTDTMILCSINPDTGRMSMISFLRDLYVQLPEGYSDNRLNVAYRFGGTEMLKETLHKNFGVSVDYNFCVDMTGFQAIVDLVGGVDITLTAAEAGYFKNHLGINLPEGPNHLDGVNARHYAQIRKIDSDLGRTSRQRVVLMEIFNKVKNLPADQLLNLMYEMLPYVSTDMSDGEILSLAYQLIPILPSLQIETHTIPPGDSCHYTTIRGMTVVVPDLEQVRTVLAEEYLPLD